MPPSQEKNFRAPASLTPYPTVKAAAAIGRDPEFADVAIFSQPMTEKKLLLGRVIMPFYGVGHLGPLAERQSQQLHLGTV